MEIWDGGLPADFVQDVRSRLEEFKADRGSPSISFPATLCSAERKYIHLAAKQAQLFSRSQGQGDARYVEVFREIEALPAEESVPSRAVPRSERLSRLLSSVLRHRAQELGLRLRPDGFARVEDVLSLPAFASGDFTAQEVQAAVATCEKQRFSLRVEAGGMWVRANQGHTISKVVDSALLVPVDRPEDLRVCVHGTYFVHWASILQKGLCAMGRNHIHFVAQDPGHQVVSGMRSDVQVALYVDAPGAMADGCTFFRSANGVILSRGFGGTLPPSYFQQAVALASGFGYTSGSVVFQQERAASRASAALQWLDRPEAGRDDSNRGAPPCAREHGSDSEEVFLCGPVLAA